MFGFDKNNQFLKLNCRLKMIFRGILLSVYRENAVKAFKNEENEEFLTKGPTKAKFYATYILIKYQKNWKSKK